MKSILLKYALFVYLPFWVSNSLASDTQISVNKSYCAQSTLFKNEDELKRDLLINAKRMAVDELFGEMIAATTSVQDFVFTSDQINASSAGFVRIDGNPRYYNGSGLTEACVEIKAYSLPADKQMFNSEEITKKYCATNTDLTISELKEFARDQVFVEALYAYDRSLKNHTKEQLLLLVRKKKYLDEGFIPETETFCVKGSGDIKPIEVITLINSNKASTSDNKPKILSNMHLVKEILIQSNIAKWLQVSEVVAMGLEDEKDLALDTEGATVQYSSIYNSSFIPAAVIDGVAPPMYPLKAFASRTSNPDEYLKVILPKGEKLKSITIYGRTDCCYERDIYQVTLFDPSGDVILKKNHLNANNAQHKVTLDLISD